MAVPVAPRKSPGSYRASHLPLGFRQHGEDSRRPLAEGAKASFRNERHSEAGRSSDRRRPLVLRCDHRRFAGICRQYVGASRRHSLTTGGPSSVSELKPAKCVNQGRERLLRLAGESPAVRKSTMLTILGAMISHQSDRHQRIAERDHRSLTRRASTRRRSQKLATCKRLAERRASNGRSSK